MFLVALSIHAQDLTPIKGGQVSWLTSAGASATTISGTDSLFSQPIDVRAYDSLHFAIALPASDSARFFVIGEFGVAGIYTGQVTADSIVSIGTAAVKNIRFAIPAGSAYARVKLRAYNTAGVPTANGITTAGKPTLTATYNYYTVRRKN